MELTLAGLLALSSGISGVLYSLMSGQPISIVGATGPEFAYTVVFWNLCEQLDLEFLPTRDWEVRVFSPKHHLLPAFRDPLQVSSATD